MNHGNPDVTIYSSGKWYKHLTGLNNRIKALLIHKDMQAIPEPARDGENRVRSEDSRILCDTRDWFFEHLEFPLYRMVLKPIINYVIAKLDYDRHAESLAIGFFNELRRRGYGKDQKKISSPYWKTEAKNG